MKNKTRIAILGIGGVGGYLGGKLAGKYADDDDFEIIFIARGENKKAIEEKGLKLITPAGQRIVRPDVITERPDEIGPVDYLICCVKSYHLETALENLGSCVTSGTVILPFLNGVDSRERIERIFPETEVWDGCVYIIVRLIEAGIVRELGNIHKCYFGSSGGTREKLEFLEKTLLDAEIEIYLSADIEQTIWDKFLLISAIAGLTSYLDLTIAEICTNETHRKTLLGLMKELKAVGEAKGIGFSPGIIEKTISIFQKTPPGITSSMHSDFQNGGPTEYPTLTEYIVRQGRVLNVETPLYSKISEALAIRNRE
jgi:2-dehydropantoate 2-reductase